MALGGLPCGTRESVFWYQGDCLVMLGLLQCRVRFTMSYCQGYCNVEQGFFMVPGLLQCGARVLYCGARLTGVWSKGSLL